MSAQHQNRVSAQITWAFLSMPYNFDPEPNEKRTQNCGKFTIDWSFHWSGTREDFKAPVNKFHSITHFTPLVWTVFEVMHMQNACSTDIQFEVTGNLVTSFAQYICNFWLKSTRKHEEWKPELIPKQSCFWFHHSFKTISHSWWFWLIRGFFL